MTCRRLVASAALLFCTNAYAGTAGWTEPAQVTRLEANDMGRFVVTLAVDKNVSGCRDATNFYVDYGRDGTELMYRVLTDALLQGKRVQVYVTGGCELKGMSAVSSVRLLP